MSFYQSAQVRGFLSIEVCHRFLFLSMCVIGFLLFRTVFEVCFFFERFSKCVSFSSKVLTFFSCSSEIQIQMVFAIRIRILFAIRHNSLFAIRPNSFFGKKFAAAEFSFVSFIVHLQFP